MEEGHYRTPRQGEEDLDWPFGFDLQISWTQTRDR